LDNRNRVLNVGFVPPNSILLKADSSISTKSLNCACVRDFSLLRKEILLPNSTIKKSSDAPTFKLNYMFKLSFVVRILQNTFVLFGEIIYILLGY
jgi:hypothetical protein